MRRIIGLLLVLYSLLLAFNTTVPLIAEIAGDKITTVASAGTADCSDGQGRPPYAGFPASCEVTWQSGGAAVAGTLYGEAGEAITAAGQSIALAGEVHELPGLTGWAFTAPGDNTQTMMAFLAFPILFIGLYALFGRKQRRGRGGHGHGHDHDDDDDDSDSDSGSDGGGGDGGGGD